MGATYRSGEVSLLSIIVAVLVGTSVCGFVLYKESTSFASSANSHMIESSKEIAAAKSNAGRKKFPTTIRKPAGPPRVFTGIKDAAGQPVTVSCSTCHATRRPNLENKVVADLNEFHATLKISHGTVSCLACHNSADYDALKLADGTRVEYTEVMTLCAQCHGQQMRDYEHGTHGGMNGYWDLTRGPREKNNCVDCHNPHSPQFPKMIPTFKPRDRFLEIEQH